MFKFIPCKIYFQSFAVVDVPHSQRRSFLMQNYLGDNLDVLTGGLVTGISGLMSAGSSNVGAGQTMSSGLIGGGQGLGSESKSTDLVFASFNQDTT